MDRPNLLNFQNNYFLQNPPETWAFKQFKAYCKANNEYQHVQQTDSRYSIQRGYKCCILAIINQRSPFETIVVPEGVVKRLKSYIDMENRISKSKKRPREDRANGQTQSTETTPAPEPALKQSPSINSVTENELLPAHARLQNRETGHQSTSNAIALTDDGQTVGSVSVKRLRFNLTRDASPANDARPCDSPRTLEGQIAHDTAATNVSDAESESVVSHGIPWLGDISLPNSRSLRSLCVDFIQRASDACDKVEFWGTNDRELLDVFDMFLLRLSKQQFFPLHQHGARFLRKFLEFADVAHLESLAPCLRPLSDEVEPIFEHYTDYKLNAVSVIGKPYECPSSDFTNIQAWIFIRNTMEHFAVNYDLMIQPNLKSHSEGWWDTIIWTPLLYNALSTSREFQLKQKELISSVDHDHPSIKDLTPRQFEELAASAGVRRDPAFIKYDGLVQSSICSSRSRFDIAFIEVKSATQFTNVHGDRNKVTRAMRRQLLRIRQLAKDMLSYREDNEENLERATDEGMKEIVLAGVLCKGEEVTYLCARVVGRKTVIFGEDRLSLRANVYAVAKSSWRLRLTLEHTQRQLVKLFDGSIRRA